MNAPLLTAAALCASGALAWTIAERGLMTGGSQRRWQAPSDADWGRHIPYTCHVAPGVIKTRAGDYQSTWKLQGIVFEATEDSAIGAFHASFNQFVRALSAHNVALWSHRIRRPATAHLESEFPDAFSREMDLAYRAELNRNSLFTVELFVTVVYRAPRLRRQVGSDAAYREARVAHDAAALAVMAQIDRDIAGSMKRHSPVLLRTVQRRGIDFSEALEFLGYLVNGRWEPMPVPTGSIHATLATTRMNARAGYLTLKDGDSARYAALLDLKDYPQFTEPGQLDPVSYGDFSFIETQSFSTLDRAGAKGYLERQRSQLVASGDVAVSQIHALDEALDQLVSGNFVLGEYHYSLAVFGEDPTAAFEHLATARAALADNGFQTAVIDLVADAAWFAQLPANWSYRPRLARLSSHNFCALAAPHGFPQGKSAGNPWGQAISVMDAPSRVPYYFNFHPGPVHEDCFGQKALGNTMIIGQTGAGKTVAQLFLLSQARRHNPTIVFFDKDRGAEIALRAMGARYLVLGHGIPSGLNPFQWEPSRNNRLFWEQLLRLLIEMNGPAVTPGELQDIASAVRTVAEFDRAQRSLTTIQQNLPRPQGTNLHTRLARWCGDGSMAWLFDNPDDTLHITDGGILGIDTTAFLDDPETCTPLMLVLLTWVDEQMRGHRFIYVMAEFWKSLSNPVFSEFIKNQQKTIRKRNGLGIFDTQSPADVLASPIARTLIEQTATFIFFPNPRADRTDYMDGFKCTEIEFNVIRSLPVADRTFLVKQGAESMLVRLDLRELSEYVDVLSGTTDHVALLDSLRANFGDKPNVWLPKFHRALAERREKKRLARRERP